MSKFDHEPMSKQGRLPCIWYLTSRAIFLTWNQMIWFSGFWIIPPSKRGRLSYWEPCIYQSVNQE